MGTRHHALKIRQRQERGDYPEDLSLRVHRALSWLDRAEQESDPDSRFIFLWIAFNAAYASEIDDRQGLSEQATFNAFLEKLHSLDNSQRLKKLVWKVYSGAISALLDNPYVVRASGNTRKATSAKKNGNGDNFLHAFRLN
ncbi:MULTISPECIES: HEPN domain-containing protein [unclassified Alcanivorax]|uniref:HEPN domain-containing protein n=1 Tax=unclassified Alcanivorax TaxID=2638842 RepID=UPI0004B253EE|nr:MULTISPECIES: HEPN domain-containing protein [unclassified Alcanivorax]